LRSDTGWKSARNCHCDRVPEKVLSSAMYENFAGGDAGDLDFDGNLFTNPAAVEGDGGVRVVRDSPDFASDLLQSLRKERISRRTSDSFDRNI
jgi:hypothetical protein